MYDFARRPRWILWHVLVIVGVVVMVFLGLWQLQRLDTRQERNDAIRARSVEAVVPIDSLLPDDGSPVDADALQWRPVAMAGTFRADRQLLVANRLLGGDPGYWVLTPLELDDGTLVAVMRGFAYRQEVDGFGFANLAPPTGRVEIEGLLQRSIDNGRFGEEQSRVGSFDAITQPDLPALAERWDASVASMWVRQTGGVGAAEGVGGRLQKVPQPDLGDGPHLSYAFQWFIFATIAVVGYPLVLRRVAQGEQRKALGLDAAHPDDIPWAPGLGPDASGSPVGEPAGHPGGSVSSNGTGPAGRDGALGPGGRRS
jgi:surfeit locus 1 family protein